MQDLLTVRLRVRYNVYMQTVSITDLKQNTKAVIRRVRDSKRPLFVLQRSQPAAVLLNPKQYEAYEQFLEDRDDLQVIEDRKNEPTASLEKVAKELGIDL